MHSIINNQQVSNPTSLFCWVSFERSIHIVGEGIDVGKQFISKLSFRRILQYFHNITLLEVEREREREREREKLLLKATM